MSEDKQNSDTKEQNTSNKPFVRYDDYWLQKGRDIIDGSIETLSNRLVALNKYLNYIIGGTFITGTSLTAYLQSSRFEVYALVALSILVIAIAKYWVSVKGTTPVSKTTDMRSPTQINENYAQIITRLQIQVKEAAGIVGAATFVSLICLPFAVYFHNCDKQMEVPKTYLSIQNDTSNLSLQGILPKAEKVSLTLYGKNAKKQAKVPIYTDLLLLKPGQLNATIDLKAINLVLDSLDVFYVSGNIVKQNTYRFKKENSKTASVKTEENRLKKSDTTKTKLD